jgi:flagellar FliL protein
MSTASAKADTADGPATDSPPAKAGGKRKLALIAAPVLLLVAMGAGGWFTGLIPHLLGMEGKKGPAKPSPPVFISLPPMIANMNTNPARPRYIKLKATVEVSAGKDAAAVARLMPRIVDIFQTYLREIRPDDLRGAAGTYRLREALIDRADVALAPARVRDILFVQMIVQ